MGRPRIINATGTYHVYARGNNKSQLFKEQEDYYTYLRLLLLTKIKYNILIYHYCLMPNHIHLVLRLQGEKNLSKMMWQLQFQYAKYFVKKYAFSGHVWEKRFQNKSVETDGYLLGVGSYVELNPIRAVLVQKPEDWVYSSYRYYAFGEADLIVDTNLLYPRLGKTPEERQTRYRDLVSKTRQS